MSVKLTHKELVKLGARWISQEYCRYGWHILTETGFRNENPDVFAFTKYDSVLIECKASRSDFLADKRKPFRRNPQLGIGRMRYYLCNEGIVRAEEMPDGWQLLVAYDKDTVLLPEDYVPPRLHEERFCFDVRNATAEIELMWSWLYRKEHDCLPVIDKTAVGTLLPCIWKQGDKAVDEVLAEIKELKRRGLK